ncbi:MAG: hypothetical protein VXW04_05080 [Bacteroidota bacterium]|nr:hypothetical protein [Bacteroidota bacterium]
MNAWDEEFYLTSFAAERTKNAYGYFVSGSITNFFQNLGISGSIQNLISDIFLVPVIFAFVFYSLLRFRIQKHSTVLLTAIILFFSVCINYANPIILAIYGSSRQLEFVMPGWESYSSILRTPEPQLSYLFIALSLAIWSRFRKWYWLFLPIPFLYVYPAMGYCFSISALILNSISKTPFFIQLLTPKYKKIEIVLSTLLPSLISYILICLAFILFQYFVELNTGTPLTDLLPKVHLTHHPNLPLGFVILLPSIVILYRKLWEGSSIGEAGRFSIHLAWCILFIANIQIISGYTISFKNIHDYSIGAMSGLSLSLFFISCHQNDNFKYNRIVAFKNIVLLFMPLFVLIGAGFSFKSLNYQIFIGKKISNDELQLVIQDPERAIITDLNVSSKIAYAFPQLNSPPFSYTNFFVPYDQKNLDEALKAAKLFYGENSHQYEKLRRLHENLKSSSVAKKQSSNQETRKKSEEFFFIDPRGSQFMSFPNWSGK